MKERFMIQMSLSKEDKEKIYRVYADNGINIAPRVLKLILDDVQKLGNTSLTGLTNEDIDEVLR